MGDPTPPAEVQRQIRQCRRLSRADSGTFHLGMALFPKTSRDILHVIYRFCRLVDDAVDEQGSKNEKQQRLRRLESGLRGQREGEPWRALDWVRDQYGIPRDVFDDLIRGAKDDLGIVRIQDFDQLQTYCYRVAGTVGIMVLHVMGYRDRRAKFHSRAMGEAFQLTNILRDVKEDQTDNRCYLPRDLLRKHGALDDWKQGRDSPALRGVCRVLARRARLKYRQSLALFDYIPLQSRFPLALMVSAYSGFLNQMETDGFLPEAGTLRMKRRTIPCLFWRSWKATRGRYGSCLLIT